MSDNTENKIKELADEIAVLLEKGLNYFEVVPDTHQTSIRYDSFCALDAAKDRVKKLLALLSAKPTCGTCGGINKYRKKPVVIEAIKWTGQNLREIIDFTGLHESARKWTWGEYEQVVAKEGLKIFTLEGSYLATVGDFIIKGIKGEFYPCKPDIFEATYEPCPDCRPAEPEGAGEFVKKYHAYGTNIYVYDSIKAAQQANPYRQMTEQEAKELCDKYDLISSLSAENTGLKEELADFKKSWNYHFEESEKRQNKIEALQAEAEKWRAAVNKHRKGFFEIVEHHIDRKEAKDSMKKEYDDVLVKILGDELFAELTEKKDEQKD